MRRFAPLIVLLLCASAVLGWLRAGISAGARAAEPDSWAQLQLGAPSDARFKEMSLQLKRSAFFPESPAELIAAEEAQKAKAGSADVDLPSGAPPFPQIIGASYLNNRRYIHLKMPKNSVAKLQQGDVLDSGWEIKTVDRRRVIAVFDDEEIEIPIISYLEAAFKRPEGDALGDTELDGTDTKSGGE